VNGRGSFNPLGVVNNVAVAVENIAEAFGGMFG